MSTSNTHSSIADRPPLTRQQRRRYSRMRCNYQLSALELCVLLLRTKERASFEQIGNELGLTPSRVREIDQSMTARALSRVRRGGRDNG